MPDYTISLSETDVLTVKSTPLGGTRLFYQGKRLKRKGLRPTMQFTRTDGIEHTIQLKGRFLDNAPRIFVDEVEQVYVEDLPTWAYVFTGAAALQMLASILLVGGPLGMLPGALAIGFVPTMIRSGQRPLNAALGAGGVVVAAWVAWAVWAVFVSVVLLAAQ